MATTQYIGARYVPKFADPIEWDSKNEYDSLIMVKHLGDTYITKRYVPAGIDIANEKYWVLLSNFSAQLEQYRAEVKQYDNRINANASGISENAAAIASEANVRADTDATLNERISNEVTALTNATTYNKNKLNLSSGIFSTNAFGSFGDPKVQTGQQGMCSDGSRYIWAGSINSDDSKQTVCIADMVNNTTRYIELNEAKNHLNGMCYHDGYVYVAKNGYEGIVQKRDPVTFDIVDTYQSDVTFGGIAYLNGTWYGSRRLIANGNAGVTIFELDANFKRVDTHNICFDTKATEKNYVAQSIFAVNDMIAYVHSCGIIIFDPTDFTIFANLKNSVTTFEMEAGVQLDSGKILIGFSGTHHNYLIRELVTISNKSIVPDAGPWSASRYAALDGTFYENGDIVAPYHSAGSICYDIASGGNPPTILFKTETFGPLNLLNLPHGAFLQFESLVNGTICKGGGYIRGVHIRLADVGIRFTEELYYVGGDCKLDIITSKATELTVLDYTDVTSIRGPGMCELRVIDWVDTNTLIKGGENIIFWRCKFKRFSSGNPFVIWSGVKDVSSAIPGTIKTLTIPFDELTDFGKILVKSDDIWHNNLVVRMSDTTALRNSYAFGYITQGRLFTANGLISHGENRMETCGFQAYYSKSEGLRIERVKYGNATTCYVSDIKLV